MPCVNPIVGETSCIPSGNYILGTSKDEIKRPLRYIKPLETRSLTIERIH